MKAPRPLTARKLWDEGQRHCAYCGRYLRLPNLLDRLRHCEIDATLDHKTPRSRGGTNHRHNIVLSCRGCNRRKGDMTFEEWTIFMKNHPSWWRRPLVLAINFQRLLNKETQSCPASPSSV